MQPVIGSVVREEPLGGPVPLYVHPGWPELLPGFVQGTTARGGEAEPFDLGLSGGRPVGSVLGRWRELGRVAGTERLAHSRQVHRAEVLRHDDGPPGLLISDGYDGHITATPGVLLTVSVADCVPIFVADPERPAAAVLHGGWRGVAAGILERGVRALGHAFGSLPDRLYVHLGPSICGRCYEVGPEVHEALELPVPAGARPVDLRAVLARRAVALGIAPSRVTVSSFCTRCGDSPFFSHRGGDPERQMGVLALSDAALP